MELDIPIDEVEGGYHGGDKDNETIGLKILPDTDDDESEPDEDEEKLKAMSIADKKEKEKKDRERREKRQRERQIAWDAQDVEVPKKTAVYTQEWSLGEAQTMILQEFEGIDCEGAPVFEGFPSKALTSTMVSKFLIDELNLPLIGEITSSAFPSLCRITRGVPGQTCRIYGDKRVVVFTSELLVDPGLCHALGNVIFAFVARHNSRMIITANSLPDEIDIKELQTDGMSSTDLMEKVVAEFANRARKRKREMSGLPSSDDDEEAPTKKRRRNKDKSDVANIIGLVEAATDDKKGNCKTGNEKDMGDTNTKEDGEGELDNIFYVASTLELANKLREFKFKRIRNAVIGGVTGSVMSDAISKGVPAVMLAGKYNPMMSDASAAVSIVHALDQILEAKLNIDPKPLAKKARKIEKKIRKAINNFTSGPTSRRNLPQSMFM